MCAVRDKYGDVESESSSSDDEEEDENAEVGTASSIACSQFLDRC